MHEECKIAHLDLKPENILLHVKDNNAIELKLCDFGLAERTIDKENGNKDRFLKGVVGSRGNFSNKLISYLCIYILFNTIYF